MKWCSRCRRELTLKNFGALGSSKDGLNPTCRECRRALQNKFYQRKKRGESKCYGMPISNSLKELNRHLLENSDRKKFSLNSVGAQAVAMLLEISKLDLTTRAVLKDSEVGNTVAVWDFGLCDYWWETLADMLTEKRLKVSEYSGQDPLP